MLFALNTFLWSNRFDTSHIPLLAHIKELGADTVEIQRSGFDEFPVEAIRREVERLGLGCTLATSPPAPALSLIAADPEARRAGIEYLREAIAIARDLGSKMLIGPLYAPPWWFTGARATVEQRAWAIEGFCALEADLERADIELAIEPMNRFETFFLATSAEAVALCQAINNPRVGTMLDTAHMVIEEKDPVAAIRTADRWLKHLQLPESDRGTPGTGTLINWKGLFKTLVEINYTGGCSIESFPFADPAFAMQTRSWRDLASSTDDLARDGLAFLRRMAHEAALRSDPPSTRPS